MDGRLYKRCNTSVVSREKIEVRGRIELPSQDLQSHTLAFMLPNQVVSK